MAVRNAVSAEVLASPAPGKLARLGPRDRGISVYHLTDLIGAHARTKSGEMRHVNYEQPLFYLDIDERVHIFKQCAPIFGLVTSRMNRISGLKWKILADSKDEDRKAEILKYFYGIYQDYANDPSALAYVIRTLLMKRIRRSLREVRPDLANFDRALFRWSKMMKFRHEDRSDEIQEWLSRPNAEDDFSEYVKKVVFDYMIHGVSSTYKKFDNKEFNSFYALPGGTVFPVKSRTVNAMSAYVQIADNMDPLLYFQDELSYSEYVPTTYHSYGMVPLEALVNKVAEYLLFDELAAERADGTKPPEKLVVLGETLPFGMAGAAFNMDLPMNEDEQKRVEQIINEERKDAIRVISGIGQPEVVDMSRADTFEQQSARQRQLREDIALVYNTTNMEVNLTGTEGTSGRNTSESQERIDLAKGIGPLVMAIKATMNQAILPAKYGAGYEFDYDIEIDERHTVDLLIKKMETTLYTQNELRIEQGRDPIDDPEADKLPATSRGAAAIPSQNEFVFPE